MVRIKHRLGVKSREIFAIRNADGKYLQALHDMPVKYRHTRGPKKLKDITAIKFTWVATEDEASWFESKMEAQICADKLFEKHPQHKAEVLDIVGMVH